MQAGLLLATGGGVITSLLLDEPVPFFRSNVLGVTWTLCWWLMLYFPYGLVYNLHSMLPIRMTTKVLSTSAATAAHAGF